MNNETFWQQVARRLDAGTPVFVSLVVANTRGSPGTVGARLLVDAEGVVAGTIGGGIMEAKLIDDGHQRLRQQPDKRPELRHLVHRKRGTDYPSGLMCAGEQTNINLILDPEHDSDAIRRFSRAVEDQNGQVATLTIDAGGLQTKQIAHGSSATPRMTLSGTDADWRYRESSINPKRLAIVGGGHCGKALANLALHIGYWVDVFDTRDGVLHGDEWPDGVRCHTLTDYSELNIHLSHRTLTTMVVMTAAVVHDITALASVASTNLHWLGVMGSAAKIHEIRTQLAERGIDHTSIDAIHGPIGLPMKSDTPAEIAVSIMGQLLANQAPNPHAAGRSGTQCGG